MSNDGIKGIGISLRFPHFDDILKFDHEVPWFEVIADDFLNQGPHWGKLQRLRENKPIAMHSIGMNVGGVDDWCPNYLKKLKSIYDAFEPEWISDHLCWSSHGGKYHHDLLPIPRSKEGLVNVVERINYLQDFFNRNLILENITQYIEFKNSDYSELEFIKEVVNRTGCLLLLDITNMVINHKNRSLSYKQFLSEFPMENVKQFHLAGGFFDGETWIDSHSDEVGREDVQILKDIHDKGFLIPGVIERDGNIPSFQNLALERSNIEERVYGL